MVQEGDPSARALSSEVQEIIPTIESIRSAWRDCGGTIINRPDELAEIEEYTSSMLFQIAGVALWLKRDAGKSGASLMEMSTRLQALHKLCGQIVTYLFLRCDQLAK